MYVSWHWRVMQSLKKNWVLVQKLAWEIWWISMWAVTSLKIYTLMCYFCQQHIKFQLKRYRRIISPDTEKRSKKNWIFAWKMIWGIWWTLIRVAESLKICTLMGYFCRKYVVFELQNAEVFCCEKWCNDIIWWIFTQVVES